MREVEETMKMEGERNKKLKTRAVLPLEQEVRAVEIKRGKYRPNSCLFICSFAVPIALIVIKVNLL